jgi:hypothetical protein
MKRILIFCILLMAGCQTEYHSESGKKQAHCIQAPCEPKMKQIASVKKYFVRITPATDYTALKIRMEKTDAEVNPSGPWFWYVMATPSTAEEISKMPGVQYIEEHPLVQTR